MSKGSHWLAWTALGIGIALGHTAANLNFDVLLPIAAAPRGNSAGENDLHAQADKPAATPKPNIVFMLTDNLGYGEVGCYGGGILRGAATPRIDRLAGEGLRLLNFNVESQCTPSRSALMTGRFAIRSGTMKVPRGGAPYGLTQWEVTIARLSAQQGYATGHFGKWHLGDMEGRYPTEKVEGRKVGRFQARPGHDQGRREDAVHRGL